MCRCAATSHQRKPPRGTSSSCCDGSSAAARGLAAVSVRESSDGVAASSVTLVKCRYFLAGDGGRKSSVRRETSAPTRAPRLSELAIEAHVPQSTTDDRGAAREWDTSLRRALIRQLRSFACSARRRFFLPLGEMSPRRRRADAALDSVGAACQDPVHGTARSSLRFAEGSPPCRTGQGESLTSLADTENSLRSSTR